MYDIIIIGGGPAGFSAAVYGARGGFKTCLFEKFVPGGQMGTTFEVENYPSYENISGTELAEKFERHARALGAEIRTEAVKSCEIQGDVKKVVTSKGVYSAKAVIFATGATPRHLDVPGENRLSGSGVSYCATCDGAFFRNKTAVVVGGGDTAAEDAIFLSKLCKTVYLVHRRGQLRAAKRLADRVFEEENVIPVMNSAVTEINGSMRVESVSVKNLVTDETEQIETDSVFIAVGTTPNVEIIPETVAKNDGGYIITDEKMQTNIKGVYAAGDIREKPLRQIITAAADGAVAAVSASLYAYEDKINQEN